MSIEEERERECENELLSLLKQHPELYTIVASDIFPTRIKICANAQEILEKSSCSCKMYRWGLLNQQLYLKKLEGMVDRLYLAVKEGDPSAERSQFSCLPNALSMFDMGRREKRPFLSPLDDKTHPLNRTATQSMIEEMLSSPLEELIPEELKDKEILETWLKITAAYDLYVLNPHFSDNAIEKGARAYVMAADNVFDVILGLPKPRDLCSFKRWLDQARNVLAASKEIMELGARQAGVMQNPTTKRLEEFFSKQSASLEQHYLQVGFNSSWEDNYHNHILGVCLFHAWKKVGDRLELGKKEKRSLHTLLYCLDPATHMLYFSGNKDTNFPQAVAIFFEAKDHSEVPYLVLEGVIANDKVSELVIQERDTYRNFQKGLFQPNYFLDMILHYSLAFAKEQNKSLLIPLHQVTGTEEYGPQEFLHYLGRLFPEYRHGIQVVRDFRQEAGNKKLVIADDPETAATIYLEKESIGLQRVLNQYGIDVPEHLQKDGRIRLLNHAWANPREDNTWCNVAKGKVSGLLFPLKELRKMDLNTN
ncbi:MAG: hypothetical protein AABX04_01100 [Nanoarchaeota archaeon]